MQLILASSNNHKVKEIQSLLPDGFEIKSLKELGYNAAIPETGSTYIENALQKARLVFNLYQVPVVSDDSGLEVDALNGAPGILSARYSGDHASDSANVQKLMREMLGQENRRARFKAAIALIVNNVEYIFEGECEGRIALESEGTGGFGYDPVFIPEGFERTFAELPAEVKNEIGHRGKAVRKLVDFLIAFTNKSI